ncbi:hypothetical protein [Plantactinospora sp. KLBMP9567]|uniref:hypothetical protein n=1 Tax=Plantactinospora sp. KLBMP9567 TaxID=3085900 RepID=UPI0029822B5A|nr:hypothetical protein [Plantactinospora sp. KLBMP9567]MDW5330721.1 hypothetical protein [Plantactinospora sp. KLBMP9567]
MTKILGLAGGGGSYRSIKRAAARLELDAGHFRGQGWNKGLGKGRNLELQRAAQRRWYEKNKQVYLDRNDRRRRKLVALLRSLKDEPCTDCGGRYPYFALEFDHRDDEVKEFDIADGVRSLVGTGRLVAEMKKCDLVCVICHRFRTALRAGWDGMG